MSGTFHEVFLLGRILQGIFFLARFLQDVLQKNALSCKTLKENLARSLQGTHFFYQGSVTGLKTFQMRIKIKVKTNENQHASDLFEKRQINEIIPNADEKEIRNE